MHVCFLISSGISKGFLCLFIRKLSRRYSKFKKNLCLAQHVKFSGHTLTGLKVHQSPTTLLWIMLTHMFTPSPLLLTLAATLTSYSAESAAGRDEGAKYPSDGYGSSRQKGGRLVVPSTSSSCVVGAGRAGEGFLYKVEGDMAASTYSLNKLHPDRGSGSSHSPGSTHSIPLYLMPRPNSVAGNMLKLCNVNY